MPSGENVESMKKRELPRLCKLSTGRCETCGISYCKQEEKDKIKVKNTWLRKSVRVTNYKFTCPDCGYSFITPMKDMPRWICPECNGAWEYE